jgi:hypothetical protein
MKVVRRTFEAAKFPKGSPERVALNGDWLTSEYMPSYKYGLLEDDGTKPRSHIARKPKQSPKQPASQ